jgi:glyoxylase-like metal-dependent hydrolase (beta-lactamase superfamily II)
MRTSAIDRVSDRRDFLRALVTSAAGITFAWSAYGQAAANPAIQVSKMSDKLAVMINDGGNVGVVVGSDGLMMIDGGYADRAMELQKAIAEGVDTHKVQLLFNTHWHGDHVGSNEMLGAAGVKIMAHENTKKRLGTKIFLEAFDRNVDPLKPEGIPTQTFSKGGKMTFGEKIEYNHIPQAHTDGDVYLFFPGPNIIHTGDLFFSGMYPVIDYTTGGWIGGMASALDALLKVGDAQTRIIPGHGPMSTKAEMQASRDMLHTIHDRLETLSRQHKTSDEVVALKPTKDFDDKFGKGVLSPDIFVKVAYASIGRHSSRAGQAA